jgi:predicted flap endonuclease-1-like 5' DNA nuclease
MSLLACCLWWFVLGALAGWLLSWLLNRLVGRTAVHEIPAPASPAPVVAAATAPSRVDDLVVIEGIGPKIAELLRRHGIDSFETLARTDVATLWSILDKGGPRFRLANPGTWPAQALYCVRGDWTGLKRYQDELYVGIQLLADVPAEVVIDVAAAKAAGFDMKGPDDLEVVEGIGPKIAQLLRQHGITTFVQLASASPVEISAILQKGGPDFRIANPGTWPEQAGHGVRNDWAGLKRLQDRLTAGRE